MNNPQSHIPMIEVLYDAFDNVITDGVELAVQKLNHPVPVYRKEDGFLYFAPYGEEERVGSYFRQDLNVI